MKAVQNKESIMGGRVDRKIHPSRSQSGITRQASWCQTEILETNYKDLS